MSSRPPNSGFAIASCVLGILGFVTFGLTSVPAIICGRLGWTRVRRSGGAMGGGGLARAGLITGYVSLVFVIIVSYFLGTHCNIEAAHRSRTVLAFSRIHAGLELYRETFGAFPAPAKTGVHLAIDGKEYDVSGALMLYQVFTGDGDDMIQGHDGASPSDGVVSEAEAKNVLPNSALPMSAILKTTAGYIIVDGYGHPFQYTSGGADSVNATYDLWSFGLGQPSTHVDKAMKRDVNVAAWWTRNW